MLTGKISVTTARNATGSAAAAQARAWAEQLGALYVERPHNMGVDELMAQYDLSALIVGEKDGPRIHSAARSFAYHPGMAVLRLQQLKRGATEHLLTALDLRPGKECWMLRWAWRLMLPSAPMLSVRQERLLAWRLHRYCILP